MILFWQTLRTVVIGLIVLGALLFIPAGTLAYWPGWGFIVTFTVMTNIIGLWLALKNPALLARRIKGGPAKETRPLQRLLISVVVLAFVAVLILSAIDWRLGWSGAPLWVIILGDAMVVLGLYLALLVLQQNSYAASTIETMDGQTVISSGLYGVVRHPMYLGTLILSFGIPLALGSYWGLLIMLLVIPVLMLRIGDEERMLVDELKGYDDYRQKVRFRLIPAIW
jgi:protein-S-isoprenylcysteine O-methyltransferase Ste14